MRIVKCLLIAMMALMITACGGKEEEAAVSENKAVEETTQDTAENQEPVKLFGVFDSQTLDGEEVTEEIFAEADLTMVNIWGTFCNPCIMEMPDLGELSREYADKGFQIVGLVSDVMEPGDETAMEIVKETKADYRHLIASEDLINNVLRYVSSVPTTVFVDREGNVVGEVYSGMRDKETWELIITQCLVEVQE